MLEFLKTLKKIDVQEIKNIDWARLKDDLRHRPDILLNILLIGLTIFVTITMFKNHTRNNVKFAKQIQLNKAKIDELKELAAVSKKLQVFIDKFPRKLSNEELVDRINDLAFKHKIQLVAFTPAEKKADTFSEIIKITITISCQRFEDMIGFLSDLEESDYAIRVDQWLGRMSGGDSKPKIGEEPADNIVANVDVSVVKLRNE